MSLRVEPLEGRETPATDVGLGELYFGGHYVRPFEDWRGPLTFLQTDDEVWVGAGPGGGPRVAVFDLNTGERTRPDFFAGDPSGRYGVVFVEPEVKPVHIYVPVVERVEVPVRVEVEIPVPISIQIPELTLGDTSHPDPFTVYVDWERPPSVAWVENGMAKLATNLPIPGLVFTTVRPNDWPGLYGTAVVTDNLDYADEQFGESVAGLGFADWTDRPNYGLNEFVQAGYEHSTPELIGDLLAHEISHGLGWKHGMGDWRDNLDVVAEGVARAIAAA